MLEMVLALLSESALALSDDVVEAIVDKTIMEADSKGDGRIDPDEWKEFVARNPSLIKNMTLPYLKDLTLAFPSFLLDTEVQDSEGLPRKIHRWYQVPFPKTLNTSKDVMENLVVSRLSF